MKLLTYFLMLLVLPLALLAGCGEAERLPPGTELAEVARYEADFKQHYEHNYVSTGYGYDQPSCAKSRQSQCGERIDKRRDVVTARPIFQSVLDVRTHTARMCAEGLGLAAIAVNR